ncbi:protein phosphatase 2C domain-containing protein [Sporosarcina sp. ACRSL]|uniref:protein phosphatase 2C domain-containing protein n=1 Tax=Sporosarcina sp. ACRSL TaxID=2918215 RepID=UPI001EF74AE6|nr:protein phosphatase 2C domain-containing protein [Sporosarcina sp. ACRSL]MCG7342641.1 protein phosphatase 2C domain-containing protein [Sporosarcina sp. ACRSL]
MRNKFSWVGSEKNFIDEKDIQSVDRVTIGRFGGNSSAGQYKNEDGCLVWIGEGWEFAAILDAHYGAESAELVIQTLEVYEQELIRMIANPGFHDVQEKLLSIFQSDKFLEQCKKVKGETACLICIRKENYLWWFSVGDCVVYVFHPDLIALGQFQLNQRQFYEWIGRVNTFDKTVPCFSSGVRELRKGVNRIFMTTDGLLECPGEPFSNPIDLANIFNAEQLEVAFSLLLNEIEKNNVRDSTTMIAWAVEISKQGSIPSDFIENK